MKIGRLYNVTINNVRVLDFIGNFKKVDLIPLLLGNRAKRKKDFVKEIQGGYHLPMDCQVDFDFEVVDLMEKAIRSRMKRRDLIKSWYLDCREELSRNPSRVEFFEWLTEDQYQNVKKVSRDNPFKDYLAYTNQSEEETDEKKFIHFIETTSMSQLYKLPVIEAFVKKEIVDTRVSKEELIEQFKHFYKNTRNRLDLERNKATRNIGTFEDKDWWRIIKKNPIKFLCKTHDDIFDFQGDHLTIKLDFSWSQGDKNHEIWFRKQVMDVLQFRREEFLDQRLEK